MPCGGCAPTAPRSAPTTTWSGAAGSRGGRSPWEAAAGPPILPQELQGALESLYGHYKRQFAAWESDQEGRENGRTPPAGIRSEDKHALQ